MMSVLVSTNSGFVVSHQEFIRKVYTQVESNGSVASFEYKPEMFMINTPFKKNLEAQKDATREPDTKSSRTRKRKRTFAKSSLVERVQNQAKLLVTAAQERGFLSYIVSSRDISDNNSSARTISDEIYKTTGQNGLPETYNGANGTAKVRLEKFGNQEFLFPNDCRFFCNNVLNMDDKIEQLGKFDLVVIDPPWWNKYIRRKKAHDEIDGYKMLSCDDLLKIPIAQLLNPGALLAVWCTNSESHLSDLQNHLMPSWGVRFVSSWCWLKVTNAGEPVCPYAKPPGKQPFEQLLFGIEMKSLENMEKVRCPEDGLLLLSVPSAVHSHKPPLLDVLKDFLPPEPKCLEIFARSLLPQFTSWGLEVIKLQHKSLFQKVVSR